MSELWPRGVGARTVDVNAQRSGLPASPWEEKMKCVVCGQREATGYRGKHPELCYACTIDALMDALDAILCIGDEPAVTYSCIWKEATYEGRRLGVYDTSCGYPHDSQARRFRLDGPFCPGCGKKIEVRA